MKLYDVVGLGNTLMDFVLDASDDVLHSLQLVKGESHIFEEARAQEVLLKVQGIPMDKVPGGSSANALRGVALLGGKALLYGKVGDDEHGEMYIREIERLGVVSRIGKSALATGHAVTFISPDGERTFSVHLGAALQLAVGDITEEDIQTSKILHLEGYQLEGKTRDAVMHAIALAKKHDTKVSLDMADPGIVRRNKEFLTPLIRNSVDIVFMNEAEAREFTGSTDGFRELVNLTSITIVKLGTKGSLLFHKGSTRTICSYPVQAIDTTGAGDSYAAGLLYGHCHGWELEKAAELGSLFASKVVQQRGVGMKGLNGEELKSVILRG